MKTVVVIGGGVTGLSTMHYLQKLKREQNVDVELILVEKNEYLGGKIHTVLNGEYKIETGADSIVARHESVMPLVTDLQLENEVAYNATGISYIYTNNELHPIPKDTVFGIPTSKESLFSSTLVSDEGKKLALKDYEMVNDHFTLESSIGEFLEHFLGKELVEKQIAPVLSGVYSGNINELTLASTLPYLLEYKQQYGSIIEGLNKNKEKFQTAANKKFLSFNKGLSTLINEMENELEEVEFIKGVKATKVSKENVSYEISFSNFRTIQADYVVLTTPHHVTQELLNNEDLDKDFNKLTNASLTSIYLGFDIPDERLPADGTGFIVSENNDIQCNACTWTSRKWKHTSEKGNLLVRLFYKSSNPSYQKLKNMNEDGLVEAALQDIEKSLGIKGKPQVIEVTNWENAMPNYHLEHKHAVHSLIGKMETNFPNAILAGCSYYGVGIGMCIKNGNDTAAMIIDRIKKV
ncbi:protoporphyrinogen oxidase [Bacillus sp. FJAT-45350]|uniref:protoporphyrinogen oxidase n=1 Tax=Bacillus sp. FJAT-45350 TaxID=2011014 RepID=UPI000BB979F1|nr:protoporphyrinogen oxidase [Bacillus sp. FJAT-45350]